MIKFTVTAANGQKATYEGIYNVTQSGVLSVRPKNGNPRLYSAVGWLDLEVEDAPDGRDTQRIDSLLHGS